LKTNKLDVAGSMRRIYFDWMKQQRRSSSAMSVVTGLEPDGIPALYVGQQKKANSLPEILIMTTTLLWILIVLAAGTWC